MKLKLRRLVERDDTKEKELETKRNPQLNIYL